MIQSFFKLKTAALFVLWSNKKQQWKPWRSCWVMMRILLKLSQCLNN